MKVPVNWLKELVNIRLAPDQLADLLTMNGLESVVEPGNILEVDVLPNRSDCWSVLGIARETAALTKSKVKSQKSKIKEISRKTSKAIRVEVKDKELCPRYMARVIENVRVAPSPEWLRDRLEAVGLRSVNNVVDVTNYLLMELGQPMHAFDAKLISGQQIIVRRAKPKEKMTTLDGKEHELGSDTLVIADPDKAIAVGGVMGGANTEVNEKTRTIVLESAYFNPVSIHKTSKLLKLRTDSSVRFEHGVDWEVVETALDRGAAMIAELGKGNVLKGKIDVKARELKPKVVELRPQRVNQILGTKISTAEMNGILKKLGFKVKGKKIIIPLYRAADIYREIDLIEEIARLYGYDKIAATMPSTAFPGKAEDREDLFRARVREILAGCGLIEVQTYSMLGPKDFEKTALSMDKAVRVANPMNVEESIMRTQLLPGLLNVLVHNLNRQIDDVLVFEIGKTFEVSGQKLPTERWALCVLACGSPFMSALDKGNVDYFYCKGILENLLTDLNLKEVNFGETLCHLVQPGKGAKIEGLGLIGELHPDIRRAYGIEKPVCFFELDLGALYKLARIERRCQPLPKFPSVARDIAMFVPPGLEYQAIISAIKGEGGVLVEEVFLFDKYKDSLAFRIIYRDPERSLTDAEVNARHEEISQELEKKLNVRIRR